MARVRQPYDEPVIVPWLDGREVSPGEIVGVPDADLPGYLEAGWEPGDAETKRKAAAYAKEKAAAAGDQVDAQPTEQAGQAPADETKE